MSFSYSNPCDVPATLDFSDTSVAGPPPNMWLQMRFTDSNGFSIIKPMTIPPGASGTLTGVTAAHSGQLTVANTTTIGPVAATIDRSDGTQPPMRVLGPTITVTPNIPTIRLTVNPVSLTAKTNQTVNWQISDNSWPYQRRTFNFNPDGYLLLTGVQQLGVDFFAPAVTAPIPISVTVTPSFWALDLGRFVDGPPTNSVTVTVNPQANPNAKPLQIEAVSVVPGNDDEFISTTDPKAQTAHFPLGSKFRLRLLLVNADGTKTGVPAGFTLGAASFQNALSSNSVFPDSVVLAYAQPGNDTGEFQAVHLGSQQLTIIPVDKSIGPVQLTLLIERPAALGITHPEVDALALPIADRKGIPPQYVKGQMHLESGGNFNPRAFRYEPLSNHVGDFGVISRHQDLRAGGNPYPHYRLATDADCVDGALPAGDLLLANDISPRSLYQICPNGQCRAIADNDQFVTALDIINSNPGANWSTKNPANFRIVTNAARIGDTCTSVWTAQTTLASSYGFFQVMYVTAIDRHWTGADGNVRNPSLLFDTSANLAIHGGSSELGTDIVAEAVVRSHRAESNSGNLNSENSLQAMFRDGWSAYNTDPTYPGLVLRRTALYPPRAARTIF